MTSGIYQLTFSDGNNYIGKSINIEKRWQEHYKSILQNKAAAKMQAAYKRCGMPEGEILFEAHPHHIDFLETLFIGTYKPSLNTSIANEAISAEHLKMLKENDSLLKESTYQHIWSIVTQRKNIEHLEDEVKKLLEGYEVPQHYKEELGHAHAAMYAAKAELRDYKRLPWYKRIFA